MFKSYEDNWAWWHKPVGNSALGWLRQEAQPLKDSLQLSQKEIYIMGRVFNC